MSARSRAQQAFSRRAFVGVTALGLIGALGACTWGKGELSVDVADTAPASTTLPGTDLARTTRDLCDLLYAAADVAVVATPENAVQLAAASARGHLPLLVGTDSVMAAALAELGVRTVVTATGTDLTALDDDVEIVEIDPADPEARLPEVTADAQPLPITLLVDPELELPAQAVAAAMIQAVGGTVAEIPGGDPGRDSTTVATAKKAAGDDPATGVIALGESFGSDLVWAETLHRAVSTPELPGGGITAFPARRMVAMYGSPGVPSLGVLGEQSLEDSITRVQELVAEYDGLAGEQIVPAFEIISTIASAEPGSDGDYSSALPAESLREWVDAAGEAGVYVVLDLQPGTTDFLTQAKMYEELLIEPHVGLALDAEWRLKPGQKHLAQIGSVPSIEINETSTWLADLTAEHGLPQKVLILHQFTHSMIGDREAVDTSRPELAITLHADGHGVPGDKLGTYRALQQDLPEGIFMAWKNFYDEDTPMFTPEETYAVDPRPWFVSYQ